MNEAHTRRLLTIKELKEATGLSVSTLRRRVKDGTLSVIQPGGSGKKLLFPPSIIDDLCVSRASQPDAITDDVISANCEPRQCISRPPANRRESDHSAEVGGIHSMSGGITRPTAGPIPNWMRSPLLNKREPRKDNTKK